MAASKSHEKQTNCMRIKWKNKLTQQDYDYNEYLFDHTLSEAAQEHNNNNDNNNPSKRHSTPQTSLKHCMSGRLDWTQTKVKHWKIWKFIWKKIQKNFFCLDVQTKCSNMYNEILNVAIDTDPIFKYRGPNNLFENILRKCVDNLQTMCLRIFLKSSHYCLYKRSI